MNKNIKIHFKLFQIIFLSINILCTGTFADMYYVSKSGNNTPPYTTWETAATTIQAAVDAATDGDTVLVTNGTYTLSNQITITKGIELSSVGGPNVTVLDKNEYGRCCLLSNSNAILKGFTVSGGTKYYSSDSKAGAGIRSENATIDNCIITDNSIITATSHIDQNGGGISANGGIIRNCVIKYNSAWGDNARGAGVACNNTLIENCTITKNNITKSSVMGGGIYCAGSVVRNCSITYNASSNGGGIRCIDSLIENCIITHNWGWSGGGIYALGSSIIQNCTITKNFNYWNNHNSGIIMKGTTIVRNSIVYNNSGENDDIKNYIISDSASFITSCTTPLPLGAGNITNNPMFLDPSNDLHLLPGSPCIDAGSMISAPSNDYEDVIRPLDGDGDMIPLVDMGAYESPSYYSSYPKLVNEFVVPSIGSTSTLFRFEVDYQNTNAFEPTIHDIYIDGIRYTMYSTNASASNTTYMFETYLDEGQHSYHFRFASHMQGSIRLPVTGSFDGPFVNLLPELSDGYVTPNYGFPSNLYTFLVDYYDEDGSALLTNYVYINGESFEMSLQDGTPFNGTYVYTTMLEPSSNSYHFLFVDNNGASVRFPVSGDNPGPIVNSREHYVSLSGEHCWPYANWSDAATNIQDAVNAALAGAVVWVTNHSYVINTELTITNEVTLQSVGSTSAVIDGNDTTRCLYLSHPKAVVDGFKIINGQAVNGGGIYCNYGGTVRNCTIANNNATGLDWINGGGGIYCESGGIIENCTIISNHAVNGAGVYCYSGGQILNSLVVKNTADGYAGGVYCRNNGLLQHCTVVDNTATIDSGGLGLYGVFVGSIRNTIIYFNMVNSTVNNYNSRVGMDYTFCCTTPLVVGSGNILDDPSFLNVSLGDYHLNSVSPCIDAGADSNATDQDIEGTVRPLDGNANGVPEVDIGAYEFLHTSADSDGDGLFDGEEIALGTSLLLRDTDGDLVTDGDEVSSGTDALNPNSFFGLNRITQSNNTEIVIRWMSVTGKYYGVYKTSNMNNPFVSLTNHVPANPPENTYTDTVTGTQMEFYRVIVE